MPKPRFSWTLEAGDARDVEQAAYRLTVAASTPGPARRRPLLWDSGKVASDRSFDVAYDGPP
jgi:alpha-L-rhamnosidase